jgi:hypothetical protein
VDFTILSASVASALPPPPRPPRALNMPGHKKQTMETMRSWTLGEAYQGRRSEPILRWRYIHPCGRLRVPLFVGSKVVTSGPGPSSLVSAMVCTGSAGLVAGGGCCCGWCWRCEAMERVGGTWGA